ncbi:MAG TPA: DUF502 domain-containing protein [Candidatus Polarisedimenticolaceae bacterium]|nr:DUF502 domain-containing protein [Candidatus Polarisedimenticolaceae bacterium]
MFQNLAKYFFRGLLLVVPAALTVYVVYAVIVTLDGWINLSPLFGRNVPGAGIVLTAALITLVGVLASNFATRWMFGVMDQLFTRLPLIKLLYTSLKDLIEAFVGDKKRFDRPVLVRLDGSGELAFVGFLTRDELGPYGMPGKVAVYFPQSYNFAGNLLIVPRERVTPLALDARTAMALIVSGGVSGDVPATGS